MIDSTSHSAQNSVSPPDPHLIKWLKENSVPIIGMAVGGLLLCVFAHYSPIAVNWTSTKDFTDAFANVIQCLALIAGGVWAYFKFAKGRTFQDRLTSTVGGKFVSLDRSVFLVVTTQLQNVGLSRIALDQELSSLVVFEYVPSPADEILRVKNKRLTSFRVFGDQDRYIEPNEIIERQTLIALPWVSKIGYQLEIKIAADSGYAWRATTIVDRSAFEDNENP
jgi:hypothetical protein